MRRRATVGDIRARLIAHEREMIARYAGIPWPRMLLDQLEAGDPVEVHGWQADWPDPNAHLRVESDGSVTVLGRR